MFLDSRSHPRGRRSHGRDRGCVQAGRDYELLAHYTALGGGGQYEYGRQGRIQLDGAPMLRKRRGPRADMLDRLGGGLLGVQRGELNDINSEFLGGPGGLGLGGGLGDHHGGMPAVSGGLSGFEPFHGGGGHTHGLAGGMDGGIDFMGQPPGSQNHAMAGLGGHRLTLDLRNQMRGIMRGAIGLDGLDGGHAGNHGYPGPPSHSHVHQNWFGGHPSGTGLEDGFSAMGLGDRGRHVHHQHGNVHPMPQAGLRSAHHSATQAEASHGGENIGRARHRPNGSERPAPRTPSASHHSSRADSQTFDMHAMDRPRMPYHYRHPYVEEAEGVSEADLQADLQRRAALGEVFPESGHWYDGSLMDLYYM
ncbi:hypothetical protein BDZ45DRAFT_746560 [Acephala macrosclerotiorum]|nr:hypothetical protein BDZ45DRAFT_746560 [Acephala macrosclerotiorum]